MIVHEFAELSERAGGRYLLLVDAWRGLYARALAAVEFGTPKGLADIERQGYQAARTYLVGERELIQTVTREITVRASRDAAASLGARDVAGALSERASELLAASQQHLEREITVQIERDVAFLKRAMQRAAIEIEMLVMRRGVARRAAQLEWQLHNGQELSFYFHDRAHRKWPSQRFIRTVWRDHMLQVWNEATMLTLAESGADRAQVTHADPNSRNHGMLIGLVPGLGLPTYAEIRDEVFHPGGDAILTAVSQF